MLFAGESRNGQAAAAAVILLPNGRRFTVSQRLSFASQEEAEYQGLVIGLRKAQQLGLQSLEIKGDSDKIFNQVNGLKEVREEKLQMLYQESVGMIRRFERVSVEWIAAEQNRLAHRAVRRCLEEVLGREHSSSTPRTPMQSEQIAHLLQLGSRIKDQDLQALAQGTDDFSRQSLNELRPSIPIAIQDALALNWQGDEEELAQRYRWYLRGLPAELAIRKVQLENPVPSVPLEDQLASEGQLQESERLEDETTTELSSKSKEGRAEEAGMIDPLISLPSPASFLPAESEIWEEPTEAPALNHHFVALSNYPDSLGTEADDLETELLIQDRPKEKETLPSLDPVKQIVWMIASLSEEDRARLARELIQLSSLTQAILAAIAETLATR